VAMMSSKDSIELKKGLKNVYFDKTNISNIDGKNGFLSYRGYDINDLATDSTFEEICFLLLHGRLPDHSDIKSFKDHINQIDQIPEIVLDTIFNLKKSHPMNVLQSAISTIGSIENKHSVLDANSTIEMGIKLIAYTPMIVAAHERIRNGKSPIKPKEKLSLAENFLLMLFNEIPEKSESIAIDKDFILHAEHGVNASTFSARVSASTGSDFYSCITAAISALKGPKHGGAAEGVMKMANEIGNESNANSYVEKALNNGDRIMGFGHPVYKTTDPRAKHLKIAAKNLARIKGQPKWFSIIQSVVDTDAMQSRARVGLHPNVDLWAGASYSLLDIPEDLFVPIFCIGRIPGWVAHIMEQYEKKDILRPRLLYSGKNNLKFKKLEDR
jgi:citrate synthase